MVGTRFYLFCKCRGVPVATVALNGAKNAAILAAQIIGSFDKKIQLKVIRYKKLNEKKVIMSSKKHWK